MSRGRVPAAGARIVPSLFAALAAVLSLTHYLRVVRGIMLKGNGAGEVLAHVWPIALFTAVALAIGVRRYRRTLD